MGYITRIDSNGDAEGNYTLLARRKGPDGWGIMPVGTFFLNEDKTGLPVCSNCCSKHILSIVISGLEIDNVSDLSFFIISEIFQHIKQQQSCENKIMTYI